MGRFTPKRRNYAYNSYYRLPDGGNRTIAFHDSILSKLSKLNPRATHLYLYVLGQAKRVKSHTVGVHIDDIISATGMNVKTVRSSMDELMVNNIIKFEQITRQKGMWSAEVLNPNNGKSLPQADNVLFAEVSDWVAVEFYRRLIDVENHHPSDPTVFTCPFVHHMKPHSFKVTIDRGTEMHGAWECSQCKELNDKGKSKRGSIGGFSKFYKRIHDLKHSWEVANGVAYELGLLEDEAKDYTLEHGEEPTFYWNPKGLKNTEVEAPMVTPYAPAVPMLLENGETTF